jgi:hypothetical protein
MLGFRGFPVLEEFMENIIHSLMKIGVRLNLPESVGVCCGLMVFGVFRENVIRIPNGINGAFGVLGGLLCFRTFQGLMESLHKQVRIPLKS